VTNVDTLVSTVNNLMSTMWMVISLIVEGVKWRQGDLTPDF
jgi:hypothetical protein